MSKRSLFSYFGCPERDAKVQKGKEPAAGCRSEPPSGSSPASEPDAAAVAPANSGREVATGRSFTSPRAASSVEVEGELPSSPVQKYPFRKFSHPDDIYKYIPRDDPYWMEDTCHHEDCWCEYCVIICDKGNELDSDAAFGFGSQDLPSGH